MRRPHRLDVAVLSLFLLLSCGKKNPAEAENAGLVGTWLLSTITINGTAVTPESLEDVPVKLVLNANRTGQVWFEDFGKPEGDSPRNLTWQTSGNPFSLQIQGEDAVTATYSISGRTLTLRFEDRQEQSTAELTYTRQP